MKDEITIKKSPLLKNVSWNFVFSGITGLLILIVFMQSLQLQQMKGYTQGFLQGQSVQAASAAAPVSRQTTPTRPANTGIPSQVGGC